MGAKTMKKTDWPVYDGVDQLMGELDLAAEDMAVAAQTTRDHVRAWHLSQVRAGRHLSQTALARQMGVSQPRISALEKGDLDSVTLAVLRSYVAGLGGTLRIVADFGDARYTLADSDDLADA